MTTQTEALNIAIDYMNERLEDHDAKYKRHPATEAERINILADIETVKEALAQPEQRSNEHLEPVAWMTPDGEGFRIRFSPPVSDVPLGWDALYTTPPQPQSEARGLSQSNPLTDEEIDAIDAEITKAGYCQMKFARAIEAKLKEKNNA